MGSREAPGFHTAGTVGTAAGYALSRVLDEATIEPERGKAYVTDYPVVVALDMAGVTPLPDYDAWAFVAGTLQDEIRAAIDCHGVDSEASDEEIARALYDVVQTYEGLGQDESEPLDASIYVAKLAEAREGALSRLAEHSDAALAGRAVRAVAQRREIPDGALMVATDQYRYVYDVPEERAVAVYFVTPVANAVWSQDDDDLVEARIERRWPGFDVIEEFEFFSPDLTTVWERSESRAPLLRGYEQQRRIEFHGTTLRRLRLAAPSIAAQLPPPPSPPYKEKR